MRLRIQRDDFLQALTRINPARDRKDPKLSHVIVDAGPAGIRLSASNHLLMADSKVAGLVEGEGSLRVALPGDLLLDFTKQADNTQLVLEADEAASMVNLTMGDAHYGFDAIFNHPFTYFRSELPEAAGRDYEVAELARSVGFVAVFINPTPHDPHQAVGEQRNDQLLAGNTQHIGVYSRPGFTGNLRISDDSAAGLLIWLKTIPDTQVRVLETANRFYAIKGEAEDPETVFGWAKPAIGFPDKVEDAIFNTPVQFRFVVDRTTLERLMKRLSLLLPKDRQEADKFRHVRMTFDTASEAGNLTISVKNDRGRQSTERLMAVSGDPQAKHKAFNLNYRSLLEVSNLFVDAQMGFAVTERFVILTEARDGYKRIGIFAKVH